MYKYEYEKIDCSLSGWGIGGGNVYEIDDYKRIINHRASEGWRYVGYVPTKQRGRLRRRLGRFLRGWLGRCLGGGYRWIRFRWFCRLCCVFCRSRGCCGLQLSGHCTRYNLRNFPAACQAQQHHKRQYQRQYLFHRQYLLFFCGHYITAAAGLQVLLKWPYRQIPRWSAAPGSRPLHRRQGR